MSLSQAQSRPPSLDFRALFEASPNPYMLLDRELRYVAANPAYLRVTASRLEDLVGKSLFDAFPHDPENPDNLNARMLRQSFERVLQTKRPDVIALIAYRVPMEVDGRVVEKERFWSATHTPILDDAGEVAFILQHTVDVTELQELKRALEQAGSEASGAAQMEAGVFTRARLVQETNLSLDAERRHLLSLFQQAPGFMCFLRGSEHIFELANASYYQVVGQRDIIGKSVRAALPELKDQGFYELLDRVYSTGVPFVGRGFSILLQRTPNGEPEQAFVDFVYQPIFDQSGGVTGIFVQGHDITEQKRLEEERIALLRQEQQARTELQQRIEFEKQLIGIVSHDLRNPISAILISARMLLRRAESEPRSLKTAARIQASADRASRMVHDLLDFTQSRVGSGFSLVRRPTSLVDVVRSAVDEILAANPECEIQSEVTDDTPGEWDPDRLGQIAGNLLANAVKYGDPAKPIFVRIGGTPQVAELEIRNGGAPIDPALLPRLFEPFQRGVRGIDKSSRSIGLGLYIVDQIARAHGGSVEVRSTAETGTSFTVRLPRRGGAR